MLCLRRLTLLTALLVGAPLLHAAGPSALAAGHPIVGTWSWALFGRACVETWQFRADQTLLATSGQEVAEKRYTVSPQADRQGFYTLTETVLRHNEKKDCSGASLDGLGEKTSRFVQFSPQRDKLLVCEAASLKACFGPLNRLP